MGWQDGSPVFAGRRAELERLRDVGERVRSDGARAVLVAGEAGVGKTRLLREYAHASPLRRVVTGGCPELGVDGLPFAPFVGALRQLVRAADTGADARPRELARLLPELGPHPDSRDEGRARLFEEVLTLLERTAGSGGLAVIIEDLHWADASTRDLLVFLLRNLGPARVQLLASLRTDDLHRSHPLRRLLPELERLPTVDRIDLAPLSRGEVAQQAEGIRGTALPARDLDLVYERSGGNPLFVESFLGHPDPAGAPVPDGPRELLLGGLIGLDDTARRVLEAASVAGDRVHHALLAAVAGLPGDALTAALRAAVDRNALRAADDGYAFRHSLLAEAVAADLLPGERVRLHRRYADALEAGVPGMAARETVTQLARHAYAAHDLPRALAASWRAAGAARDALAYPEHLAHLERVLELWDQVPDATTRIGTGYADVLWFCATGALASGRPRRSVEYATEGLSRMLGPDALDPRAEHEYGGFGDEERLIIADLWHARGEARKEMGRDGALEDLGEAVRAMPARGGGRAKTIATVAGTFLMRGNDADAARIARRALDRARSEGDRRTEADALITLGTATWRGTGSGQAQEALEEGIRLAREVGRPLVEFRGQADLGSQHLWRGDVDAALRLWRAGLERAAELGLQRSKGTVFLLGIADALCVAGRLREAVVLLRSAPVPENPLNRAQLLVGVAEATLLQGGLSAARSAADEVPRIVPERSSASIELYGVRAVRIRLALAEGRSRDAGAVALEYLSPRPLWSGGVRWSVVLLPAAEAAARLRRDARSDAGLAGLSAELDTLINGLLAVHTAPPRVAWEELAAGAVRALSAADPVEALGHWEAAAGAARRSGFRIQLAQALIGAAESLLDAGDTDGARPRLDEAAGIARDCGAGLLLGDIARICDAHGVAHPTASEPADDVPAAPAAPSGPGPLDSLTPRETEVLRLVARGCSNREIGAELVISVKTVSVHVSNVLGKLGVSNRNAAAAMARAEGLE
ncbi:AAA family ATPase [Nocardiopsis sediminis]|uniref:AAA family ATPase n=1 Tax=Nocardiopsis sediminis TaxID=1778267 RepID=A0ABV8FTS0_9ACTN